MRHSPWRPQGGGFLIYRVIDYNTERCCKVNILIDSQYNARLADFGLATIVDESMGSTVDELPSSTVNESTSSTVDELMSSTIDESINSTVTVYGRRGTIRWMAPELLYPDTFGFTGKFEKQLPSKDTDIYAMGMTILEVSAHPCSSETPISYWDRL